MGGSSRGKDSDFSQFFGKKNQKTAENIAKPLGKVHGEPAYRVSNKPQKRGDK